MSDTETILQLKLTLAGSVPTIWRRVQVRGDQWAVDVVDSMDSPAAPTQLTPRTFTLN